MTNYLSQYRSIRNALNNLYPSQPKGNNARHLNTLAALISGIVSSNRSNLPDIAKKVPLPAKPESRIKRFTRWLKNLGINADLYFLPFAEALLRNLAHNTIILAIDGSTVGRGCLCLMVSVIYKKRALPVAWIVVKGKKGHLPETLHIALVEQVKEMIPSAARVVVVGDGEFDGTDLQKTIRGCGWEYVCRTATTIKLFVGDEEMTIGDLSASLSPGEQVDVADALVTREKYGPVRVICWWGKGYKEPIHLVTNVGSMQEACRFYQKRYQIETFFSDQKSRGFNLHKSHLSDPFRLSRLMIANCLAYIWIIYLGDLCHQRGFATVIHRTDRCDWSLFKLGLAFLDYLFNEGMVIPVTFTMMKPHRG